MFVHAIMSVLVHVPSTGRISSAIDRSSAGPLSMHEPSIGEPRLSRLAPLFVRCMRNFTILRRCAAGGPDLSSAVWGPGRPHLVFGLSIGVMNPVHRKVCLWVLYWYSYSSYTVRTCNYVCTCACTFHRPHLFRNRSEPSRTSFYART